MPEEDSSKGDRVKRNVEWTLVIVIASALMGTAFFAWKTGSDRASCILNIRNVQNAARGMCIYNKGPGAPLDYSEIVGPGKFIQSIPQCPAGGTYRFLDRLPDVGELYVECSLCDAPFNHKPNDYRYW
jgi:hypothetical protein